MITVNGKLEELAVWANYGREASNILEPLLPLCIKSDWSMTPVYLGAAAYTIRKAKYSHDIFVNSIVTLLSW